MRGWRRTIWSCDGAIWIVLTVLRSPMFRLCGSDPLVMLLALGRIRNNFIRQIDNLYGASSVKVSRIAVGMEFLRQRFISCTDDFRRRIARDLQIVVVSMDSRHPGLVNMYNCRRRTRRAQRRS